MESVLDRLRDKFHTDILGATNFRGDETVIVTRKILIPLMNYLKGQVGFDFLMDMCGADYMKPEAVTTNKRQGDFEAIDKWRKESAPVDLDSRFEVVYHLYSIANKYRLRVKVRLSEIEPTVESVTALWHCANWFEREAYDMYGIIFKNHPNLKRLLTYPEFQGHPLRKDYPIERRGVIPTPDTLLDELERRKRAERRLAMKEKNLSSRTCLPSETE